MSARIMEKLRESARRAGVRRFWRSPPPPTNFRAPDASPQAIAADVDYGLQCGRAYKSMLDAQGIDITSANIAEIGPGPAFGAVAYLAAHGANVFVADRWLAPWREDYHGGYYRRLAAAISDEAPLSLHILELAEAGRYRDGPIALINASAEELGAAHPARFDSIVSNAVLEHVYDLAAAARSLFAATRPGGLGLHQIDYRDHRDFSQPLEHLLFSARRWEALSASVHWEYGTQRRAPDYASSFIEAGFTVRGYSVSERADPAYLTSLVPRLRACRNSACRDADENVLSDLGGLLIVERGLDAPDATPN